MKFKCFVKEAEFIMTKDELGYQEVVRLSFENIYERSLNQKQFYGHF